MKTSLITAPASTPVSLTELKLHLKIDAGSMTDNLTETQSIAPGSHAVTVGFTLLGSAVSVNGDLARVSVNSGTNLATGTVDVKIQESADGVSWNDWTGGAFNTVTTATDNAIYEKEYTGGLDYIRVVAQVLLAACEFGVNVIQYEPTSDEDALLTTILAAATSHVENITGRQLESATWDYTIQDWPDSDGIKLPFGNLSSVTSVTYTDSDDDDTVLVEGTDYTVELNGDQCGRVVLPYGGSWPSSALSPSNPIVIRFVCGYTTVPEMLQVAIKFAAQNMWRHGGEGKELTELVKFLTYNFKLWDEF